MNHFFSSFLSLWLTFWNWGGNRPPPPSNHTLDLLVNGQNDPVAIVNIQDAKPGDDWYIDKDLWVNKDAKIYLHLKDLVASDGAQTEPELQEPPQSDLQNYITYSILNFSNPLPDMVSCYIPLGTIKKNQHLKITQGFHFDKDVTNWAQGDILTFTEEFTAVSGDEVPDTGSGRVWDPTLKKCVPKPTPTPPPVPEACRDIRFSGPPIIGTPDDDNLTGTPGNDLIFALESDDKVEGNNGDDCIIGGPGDDRLTGNNGNDYLDGGPGTNRLEGNNGTDTCVNGTTLHCEP